MLRHEVNQILLDRYEAPSYLEIGVDHGTTFHTLKARRKVGVDPEFKFDLAAARADPANAACEYNATTSDAYFATVKDSAERFDVVFIDGLHTFDQTLKDLLNAMSSVRDDSLIIVDDVIPASYAASLPDLTLSRAFWAATKNPDGSWMGDVFRLVFFVEQYMPFFEYATVAENHGQMILWRGQRASTGSQLRTVESISRMEYPESVLRADVFRIEPLAAILPKLPAPLQAAGPKKVRARA